MVAWVCGCSFFVTLGGQERYWALLLRAVPYVQRVEYRYWELEASNPE